MSEKTKTNLIKYGSCLAFALVLGALYLSDKGLLTLSLQMQLRYISDVFYVSGVLLVMTGSLIWASNEGALDGVSYGLSMAVRSLIPGGRAKRDERYGDYVARRRQKNVKGYGFLFLAGGILLTIGLVLTAVYYAV